VIAAVPCVACGAGTRADGSAPDGRLLRCGHCGSRRILVPTGRDDAGYGAAYRGGADDGKVARLVDLFAASVAGASPGTLLDVGCADGGFLAAVRPLGWSGVGLDIDPAAVAAARARDLVAVVGAAGVDAVPAPARGGFDAVTLWDLLEHVADPRATAAWLADRVAPGGRVIVLTPDARSLFDRAGAWERRATLGRSRRLDQLCLNRYHLHRFSAAGLRRLFDGVGFATVSLHRLQLFSLRPERYLSGFAPGIRGWTGIGGVDGWLSRCAYAAVTRLRITNKLLYVGLRQGTP
jgi:SAM-dependent methyltransferase